jgi:antitoxin component YwqK of YwqJK toxin-antitoxin module
MKTICLSILLTSSVAVFANFELDNSSDLFCYDSQKVQINNGLFYLSDNQEPFTGENLCLFLSNGINHSNGFIFNGQKVGKWTWWYENGQIKQEGIFKAGKFNGKWTFWYANGQTKLEGIYKDDERNGWVKLWHKNGQISEEGLYEDGSLLAKKVYKYFENGQIKSKQNFLNRKLNGKTTFWYENGQKLLEGNYKDFNPEGIWIFWNKNGQKDEEIKYKDGKEIFKTVYKYSFFNGLLKSKKIFKDGKCISENC